MTHWVDEEAEKVRQASVVKLENQEIVSRSNYWALLVDELKEAVARINQNPTWKERLAGTVIDYEMHGEGRYISMITPPYTYILVTNGGRRITTEVEVGKGLGKRSYTEIFEVEIEGQKGYLTCEGQTFAVPREAARRILKPLMESLRTPPLSGLA